MRILKLITTLCVLLIITGCTDKENAERILKNDGFTHISVTGYNFFACSKDDFQHTGFIAKKGENTVEGTVCSGLFFKNSTIRFK